MNGVVYDCCFMSTLSIKCRNIHWHNVLISELGHITLQQAACFVWLCRYNLYKGLGYRPTAVFPFLT